MENNGAHAVAFGEKAVVPEQDGQDGSGSPAAHSAESTLDGLPAAARGTLGGEHYCAGMRLREAGDLEGAVKELTAAITWGEGVVSHYWRGRCFFEQGQHSRALPDFNAFIGACGGQLGPGSPELARDGHFYRGMCHLSFKQHENALRDFEVVLQLQPQDTAAMAQQAVALLGMEQHARALDCLGALLKLRPDDADGRYYRCIAGLAMAKSRDAGLQGTEPVVSAAISDLKKALSHATGAEPWHTRAEELAELQGDPQEIVKAIY